MARARTRNETKAQPWPLEWVLAEIARSDEKIQSYLRGYERQLTIIVSIATLGLGLGFSHGRRGVLLFLPLATHLLGHYGNRLGVELFAVAGYKSYLHRTMGWDEPMARIAGAVIHASTSDKTYNAFSRLAMVLLTVASLALSWPAYSQKLAHQLLFGAISALTIVSLWFLRSNGRKNWGAYDAALSEAGAQRGRRTKFACYLFTGLMVLTLRFLNRASRE